MARFGTSLALAALSCVAAADAFGRFGFHEYPPVDDFVLDGGGFRVDHPQADRFEWPRGATRREVLAVDALGLTLGLTTGERSPQKMRVDLLTLGFLLYFPAGVGLKLTSTQCPFLSFEGGSVEMDVPTPSASWIVVSFRDRQPPVAIGFPDEPTSLIIEGKPGAWTIRSTDLKPRWLRVSAPVGLRPFPTNSAASLGDLMQRVRPDARDLYRQPNRLEAAFVEEAGRSVVATWIFRESGAVVPRPVSFAAIAGYGLQVDTPLRRLRGTQDSAPVDVTERNELRVRFPVRTVNRGRPVGTGPAALGGIATASFIDPLSVAEIALGILPSEGHPEVRRHARELLDMFLAEAVATAEPVTGQRLFFGPKGQGVDLVAAQAMLTQSLDNLSVDGPKPNALMTSLSWARDWRTWGFYGVESDVERRACALAALAGALSPLTSARLEGAMFESSLAGHRGFDIWRRRMNLIEKEPERLEVFEGLRSGLFRGAADPFARLLQSPLRLFSDLDGHAEQRDGQWWLRLTAPAKRREEVRVWAHPIPLYLGHEGVESIEVLPMDDWLRLRPIPIEAGPFGIHLLLPQTEVPPLAPPPAAQEIKKS